MATRTSEGSKEARLMAEECTSGAMGKSTMENGLTDSRKVMEYGRVQMVAIHILVNGNSQRQMDMVCTFGEMETGTKVNGSNV